MSDPIKHECGIALIRLLKPLDYYREKYGTYFYGLNKLYLLMQKQHNRGQDGAGIAGIRLNPKAGHKYIDRVRSISNQPIKDIFEELFTKIENKRKSKANRRFRNDSEWLKDNIKFSGEILLGHLRYGTHGKNSVNSCHPYIRSNNWRARNLVVAGNFNLTNNEELFSQLVGLGQHPKHNADTVTVLEKIGHFLDTENQRLFIQYKDYHDNKTISDLISKELDLKRILSRSARDFDGGYVIAGMLGHGDSFVMRDPAGIRPAFWYADDEIIVAASERPAIQNAFNLKLDQIKELTPGHALIIKENGSFEESYIHPPMEKRSCSFERIYFSRGSDADIYKERLELGRILAPKVLDAIDFDIEHTIFSYIPNTAEVAFYGLIKGLEVELNKLKRKEILELGANPDPDEVDRILARQPRVEKLAVKDAKLRTFITQDNSRNDLVAHVYDTTYGQVRRDIDTLVMLDDSIVRGTTLRESILRILDRLGPKRIIIVSSAPQIRYPDCYGIDMSKMNDFVAFKAMVELIHERNMEDLLDEVYQSCKVEIDKPLNEQINQVKRLFEPFTDQEISDRIAGIVTAPEIEAKVDVIYQTTEGLRQAIPGHLGDWYFTGNYPTPGGIRVVNRAFINFMEGKNIRAYA
ncbi:MAG: amidophosphoribosyltransferase [Limisphaerales bacterium]